MSKDYYQTLGVSKTASQDEIRKAYYKLAHEHHPHKGGDEAKMKEINEAYGVLGNPDKRKKYDQFGSNYDQAGFGGFDFGNFSQGFGNSRNINFDFNDLGDVFGDMFGFSTGRSGAKQGKNRGHDLAMELVVDFSQAVFGDQMDISISKDIACKTCGGSGAQPGSKNVTCKTCGGSGQIVKNIGFGFGFPSTCPDCFGKGQKHDKDCRDCRGKGTIKSEEKITIKIPAGIDDGQSIKLSDRGSAGAHNGQAGDLYIKIRVKQDPRFNRSGFDILSKSEISFTTAALGGKIEVETIDGKVWLNIPEGTQSGKVFKLKDKGVGILNGRGRGDHLVTIIVKTPTKLSRKQKELLRQLEEI